MAVRHTNSPNALLVVVVLAAARGCASPSQSGASILSAGPAPPQQTAVDLNHPPNSPTDNVLNASTAVVALAASVAVLSYALRVLLRRNHQPPAAAGPPDPGPRS